MYNELLRVVCESNEPAARLILADWLEERGDPRCYVWRYIAEKRWWPLCGMYIPAPHWSNNSVPKRDCTVPAHYFNVFRKELNTNFFRTTEQAYETLVNSILLVEGDKVANLLKPPPKTPSLADTFIFPSSSTANTRVKYDPWDL